jgi:hypothetical protein
LDLNTARINLVDDFDGAEAKVLLQLQTVLRARLPANVGLNFDEVCFNDTAMGCWKRDGWGKGSLCRKMHVLYGG